LPSTITQLPWPAFGRLAGIDYGTVRIGVAICDPSRQWVSPYATYLRRNEALDREYFQSLAERESVVGWIVGLPIHCDGQESQKSAEVREFAEWLTCYTGLPVQFFDERFTSVLANKLLAQADLTRQKKKQRLDRVAAHLILEAYLESCRGPDEPSRPRGLDDPRSEN
jgi:putative Holliday junction resolvase